MEFKPYDASQDKENDYPKLVRDEHPRLAAERTGKESKTRTLDDNKEFQQYLLKKIDEEVDEMSHARNKDELVEETADIMEIIDTILMINDLDMEMIRKFQKIKADKRGGFKKRILMLEKA
jgi:predicted house-cleaning noncanonical NTP pyrophosphatase (MazG superfamily)